MEEIFKMIDLDQDGNRKVDFEEFKEAPDK